METIESTNIEDHWPERQDLSILRERIDEVDRIILKAIAERNAISKEIAVLKKCVGMPILDQNREDELIANRQRIGGYLGLEPITVEHLFKFIMNESKRIQQETI